MIPSYPRRALLVLAVIAFVAARASARTGTDAAFAAALSEGGPSPVQFAALKAKPKKPAAPPAAPSAPEAVWQKVLATVKTDGEYRPSDGPMPSIFAIEDSTGDPDGIHEAQTILVLGMINDDGQFEAMGAMLVSTRQTLDPKSGNRLIDQWMFQTDVYGEVGEASHGVAVKTPDGKTVSAVPEKLSPGDPKIQKQYDAMLKHWAERTPKGA